MKNRYYQESGEINYVHFALGLVALLPIALILGYVYSMLIYAIPLIYFNLLLTVGFGFTLAFAMRFIFHVSKSRNAKSRMIMVVIGVILATYFQWVGFVASVVLERFPAPLEYLQYTSMITQPIEFFGIIGEIYTYGTWGIGSFIAKGILLLLIWLVEIGITALPSIKLLMEFQPAPFSEQTNQWYPKYTLQRDFEYAVSANVLAEKLDNGVLETLQNMEEGSGMKHCKVHLFYLEGAQYQYLSIHRILMQSDGDEEEIPVVVNYRIETGVAKAIQANFKWDKQGIWGV
jgi:hypothetical protein